MNGVIQREQVTEYVAWKPEGWARLVPPPTEDEGAPDSEHTTELEAATRQHLADLEQHARERGYERGHAEGWQAGLDRGRQDIDAELRPQREMLTTLYHQVARPLERANRAVEEALAQLAMVVAERLVAHELSLHPERVVSVVRQALQAMPMATDTVTIHLHPDDVALVQSAASSDRPWRLVEDPTLERGECNVVTPRSRLDARLKTRLAAIADAVLGDALTGEDLDHG